MIYEDIERAVAPFGLCCRGGLQLSATDPLGPSGSLVLIGNIGAEMWQPFVQAERARGNPAPRHPMDSWTRDVMEKIADGFKARVVYPFDGPPYHPFQQWAMRAEAVFPSPIGPLIHPEYGLWHAYRAALLFDISIELPVRPEVTSPCDTCAGKPCLSACPVGALAPGDYDVPACVGHLTKSAGEPCRDSGCLARHACPVGRAHAYGPAQAQFHMDKFVESQGKAP